MDNYNDYSLQFVESQRFGNSKVPHAESHIHDEIAELKACIGSVAPPHEDTMQETPIADVGDGGEARLASDARNDSDEVEGGVEDSGLDLSQGPMESVHFCKEGIERGGGFLHFDWKNGVRILHASLRLRPLLIEPHRAT